MPIVDIIDIVNDRCLFFSQIFCKGGNNEYQYHRTFKREKRLYYAVVNYYTETGERKQKWFSSKLPVRGNKKKAVAVLR